MKFLFSICLLLSLTGLAYSFDDCSVSTKGAQHISKEDLSEDESIRKFSLSVQMRFNKGASSSCIKDEMKKRLEASEKCSFKVRDYSSQPNTILKESMLDEEMGSSGCSYGTKTNCPYCVIPEIVKYCKVSVVVTCEKNNESRNFKSESLILNGVDLMFPGLQAKN